MGEVVEINIVCRKKCLLYDLLHFISLQMKDNICKKSIEIMDNWSYENVIELDSDEDIDQYVGNKIIRITETYSEGQAGVDVELVNDCFEYCIWFNTAVYSAKALYVELINDFIKYMSEIGIGEHIVIGAIGKETVFEYLDNAIEVINGSHNIDVWVIDREFFGDISLEKWYTSVLKVGEKNEKEILVLTKI